MKLTTLYDSNFESNLLGRYVTLKHILPLLDSYENTFEITSIGSSESGEEIPMVKIGSGKKVVLGWSQMHGNESTTTKALFDFYKFIAQKKYYKKEIDLFLETYTFYSIPILNPDGAKLYTRVNANGIDLNRDAKNRSQKESIALRNVFESLKPDLCLNLHDQRSIYGLKNRKAATVSFLSPSADKKRSITASRKVAMELIVKMQQALEEYIPGKIGRYDDAYNANCVGDSFQESGVPTILFEAGHYENDYQREKTRSYIFYAFLSLFDILKTNPTYNYKSYFDIPENLVNFNDVIVRRVGVVINSKEIITSIAIQYEEVLENGAISFHPRVDAIGNLDSNYGHKEIEGNNELVLVNSQESVHIGQKISTIIAKNDRSLIFFKLNGDL